MLQRTYFYILIGIVLIHLFSCNQQNKQNQSDKPELLIYCGITMIQPMTEIKEIIEKQENCKITITKGGSGNLMNSILENQIGDLYLPGSDNYFKMLSVSHPNIISDTVFVGYNKAAMMVQKGNPKGIGNDLLNLTKSEYAVVIGNPTSGSIGKETKKILEKRGIYEDVKNNAHMFTTDSKDLVKVLRNNQADLVINWFATVTWKGNNEFVDVIPIDNRYAEKKRLVLGTLKYSKHPDIAKKFMNLASSEKGRGIFKKYGLYEVL